MSEPTISTPESRHAESLRAQEFYRNTTFDQPVERAEGMANGVAVPDDFLPEEDDDGASDDAAGDTADGSGDGA